MPSPSSCGKINQIQCPCLYPFRNSSITPSKHPSWAVTKRFRSNGSSISKVHLPRTSGLSTQRGSSSYSERASDDNWIDLGAARRILSEDNYGSFSQGPASTREIPYGVSQGENQAHKRNYRIHTPMTCAEERHDYPSPKSHKCL